MDCSTYTQTARRLVSGAEEAAAAVRKAVLQAAAARGSLTAAKDDLCGFGTDAADGIGLGAEEAFAGRLETALDDVLPRALDDGALDAALDALTEDGRRRVLARLFVERRDELFRALSARVFLFCDVARLDDRAMQRVLRELREEDVVLILKGSDEDVKQKICRNCSKRAVEDFLGKAAALGDVSEERVRAAEDALVAIVRRLELDGSIVVVRNAADVLVR